MTTESVLRELFDQLPNVIDGNLNEFKPKFNWGNQNALNLFLSQFKSTTKYPLIWLIEGEDVENSINKTITRNTRLFIAKQSIHQTNTNPIIWDTEFENVLNPLLENVKTALISGGVTEVKDRNFKIRRLANYSDKEQISATIDPWNVIILDFELIIRTKGCIKKTITF